MTSLLTADIHFNDNSRDNYRWGLLDWIGRQVKTYEIEYVLILGDITDAKDRHSSYLVNRLADKLANLSGLGCYVYILKGNHDYVDPDWPFFAFLDHIRTVSFIEQVKSLRLGIVDKSAECLFLPATKDYKKDWLPLEDKYAYIFAHATFQGALSENGTQLSGIPTSIFDNCSAAIFAGDIHVPQAIGPVRYIGAPYRTRFGDKYTPRCILIEKTGKLRDLHYPCPSKHVVEIRTLQDLEKKCEDFLRKDWVKVRVRLLRSEYPEWPSLKEQIRSFMAKADLELYGPELLALEAPKLEKEEVKNSGKANPADLIRLYGKENRIGKESLTLGIDLLKEI